MRSRKVTVRNCLRGAVSEVTERHVWEDLSDRKLISHVSAHTWAGSGGRTFRLLHHMHTTALGEATILWCQLCRERGDVHSGELKKPACILALKKN